MPRLTQVTPQTSPDLTLAPPYPTQVRALVYGSGSGSPEQRKKAAVALNCSACDASEGIFYGDVTVPASLTAAFSGIDTVAITTGGGFGNDTQTKAVEFLGVQNQAAAIVASGSGVRTKRIVFCSAMGTGVSPFRPQPAHGPPAFLKDIMFWQLNAEAPLHYTTLHYATLHCSTLHYTALLTYVPCAYLPRMY